MFSDSTFCHPLPPSSYSYSTILPSWIQLDTALYIYMHRIKAATAAIERSRRANIISIQAATTTILAKAEPTIRPRTLCSFLRITHLPSCPLLSQDYRYYPPRHTLRNLYPSVAAAAAATIVVVVVHRLPQSTSSAEGRPQDSKHHINDFHSQEIFSYLQYLYSFLEAHGSLIRSMECYQGRRRQAGRQASQVTLIKGRCCCSSENDEMTSLPVLC